MTKVVNRGFIISDTKEFKGDALIKLKNASDDLYFLLNRKYHIKGASTFVGNHYLLSERQRMAIVRAVSPYEDLQIRREKEICINNINSKEVNIDGFNTIITLEVALSKSLTLNCMDNTIRDLAGLRGTYRIIDKTIIAINYILETLDEKKVNKAIVFLDEPVSNSGKLKELILHLSNSYKVNVNVMVIPGVDSALSSLDNVITTDAIILNKCNSWINLNKYIIENKIIDFWCVDLFR